MSLGDLTLTEVTPNQEATFPGMAHFAGTGPVGKYCGDCANWDREGRIKGQAPRFQAPDGQDRTGRPAAGVGVQIFRAVQADRERRDFSRCSGVIFPRLIPCLVACNVPFFKLPARCIALTATA